METLGVRDGIVGSVRGALVGRRTLTFMEDAFGGGCGTAFDSGRCALGGSARSGGVRGWGALWCTKGKRTGIIGRPEDFK